MADDPSPVFNTSPGATPNGSSGALSASDDTGGTHSTINPEPRMRSGTPDATLALPKSIDRYRVEGVIGKPGGFGIVYLARDERLKRHVAIKVPHARLVRTPDDAAPYLKEAQTLANLDHRHIVKVFDASSSTEYPLFIVMEYIDGTNLDRLIKEGRPTHVKGAELIASVAEALNYAHTHRLVHRDVKPANILIDRQGNPYLADFGLAMSDADVGKGPRFAGTVPYMSPEQARGEGNRVDSRSVTEWGHPPIDGRRWHC